MLFGPTFSLEVVTGARRKRLYLVRTAYVVILLFVLWFQYESWMSRQAYASLQTTANLAYSFFSAFAWVQLVAVVLITPAVVAGSITQEYERRTIEYLFTSQLSNSEIVLGKLTARFLTVAGHLLAGLPLLAIARMLGGIPIESLLAVFAVSFITLVGVASLSIGISVFARRTRDALGRVYGILLLLLLVPFLVMIFGMSGVRVSNVPMADFINRFLAWVFGTNAALLSVHPFTVLSVALTNSPMLVGFTGGIGEALVRIAVVYSILSAVCLVAAVTSVRRRYLRLAGTADAPRRRMRWLFRGRRTVGNHPMLWKETVTEPGFSRLGIAGKISVIAAVGLVLVPTIWMFVDTIRTGRSNWRSDDYVVYSTFVAATVGCCSLLLMLGRAGASITSEKERETWATLLATTLTPKEIIGAKLIGCAYTVRWVFVLMALLWGMALVIEPSILPGVAGFAIAMAVLTAAVIAIGLVWSLGSKTSLRAMVGALGTGVFLGGGYLFCCMPVMFLGGGSGGEIVVAGCIPWLLGYPVPMWYWAMQPGGGGSNDFDEFTFAWIVGCAAYLAVAVMLTLYAIGNFDSLVGRTADQLGLPPAGRAPRGTQPGHSPGTAISVSDAGRQSDEDAQP